MSHTEFDILLVEDNPADVYLFKKAFAAAPDVQLHVVHDGSEALTFLHRQEQNSRRIDLVILDLNLPKHSGVDVLKALRQHPIFAKVPVVVTSSSSSPRDRSVVEALGIAEYIQKPPDLDDFLKLGPHLRALLTAQSNGY